MSDKKKGMDWAAEILADSETPGDAFTWTDGTNYGLDGYHFDQTMGEGVKTRKTQPGASPGPAPGSSTINNTKGISGLPEGLMTQASEDLNVATLMDRDDGFNLSAMFTEEEGSLPISPEQARAASLADLSWLDPTQEQDPERLPKELRPDQPPLNSVPELEEAWGKYRRHDGLHRLPAKDLEAERYHRSQNESPQPATPGPKLAQEDMTNIRAHIKAAVRAAHYGRSVEDIKRDLVSALGEKAGATRGAVNLLKQEEGLLGNVFVRANAFPGIQNGKWVRDLKRKARTARYVVTNDPTIATKLGMQAIPGGPSELPWAEALRHYGPGLIREGYTLDPNLSPREALRQAFKAGPTTAPHDTRFEMPKPIEVMPADTITTAEALMKFKAAKAPKREVVEAKDWRDPIRRKALVRIAKWLKEGNLTAMQVQDLRKIESTEAMLDQALKIVTVQKTGSYEGEGTVTTQDAQLDREHPGSKTASPEFLKMMKQSSDFRRLIQWAKRAMNEGWMGNEFSQLIEARWSPRVLKEARQGLLELRQAHEGLAGNLYVDAEAYASPTGVAGCKEASSKHRVNQVRSVLAMDRCGSCTLRRIMPDGRGHCAVYSKPLVEASELGDLRALQSEALHYANASDAEVTGSMFTDRHTSIVEEFGLVPSMDVTLGDMPKTEKLGEVLFDGLLLNQGEG